MNTNTLITSNDLFDNPTTRVPVCLCLDVSGSMIGDPIQELNRGVQLFYDAIREDDIASFSAEIAIVVFGLNENPPVKCLQNFKTIGDGSTPPVLKATGLTPLGEGVNLALDLLETRKKEYSDAGVDYHQPWLVLMTDGSPYGGSDSELTHAEQRTQELIQNKKLVVFPLGIGEANRDVLAQFASDDMPPMKLKDLRFRDFFRWLSQSVAQVSCTMAGEAFQIDTTDLDTLREPDSGWDF